MNTPFVEFLARQNAVRFGEFTLKSGRSSPYFIDMGILTTGSGISELGKYYAKRITEVFNSNFDVVFGPAYKAIPLSISTTMALSGMGLEKRWLFDRKEVKLHGADANTAFVGSHGIDAGAKVVLVDDVMTTGETKFDAIKKLENSLKAEVIGVVIAVDRMEKGRKQSAATEFTEDTGVPVHSIVTIDEVFTHLKTTPVDGKTFVTPKIHESYINYMKKFGYSSRW